MLNVEIIKQPALTGNGQKGKEMLNKKVIVRGDRSGVFFGTLTKKDGCE